MRSTGARRRGARIAAITLAVLVLLLVLAQLLLPGIAAQRVRDRVGKYGTVRSASVKAWPAIKLLWGDADEVRVSAGSLKLTPAQTASLLGQASGTAKLHATAATVQEGPLKLTGVSFRKQGAHMYGEATISEAAVASALPPGFSISLLHSSGGTVTVQVSGGLFGVGASVEAVAKARGGKLVAQPTSLFLQAISLTLFSNPNVYVEGVSAHPLAGPSPETRGYRLTMWASLR